MTKLRRCVIGWLLLAPAALLAADSHSGAPFDFDGEGAPIRTAPADSAIAAALSQISSEQIRHTIDTLVGFGTRNTLSSMEKDLPPGQGINAAADWIEAEFKRYSGACGGCLEVHRDTFTETPQSRIPSPTLITNVYAVLKGTDPAQAARRVLVTGHYDSRNSDTANARGAAPGANDDGSGVAVSLECARVLSKLHPSATIVFVAVAGEEEGLNGSRHLAKLARTEDWQLEAVLNNDIVGGNATPGDHWQNNTVVRVFSEGIPAQATAEQLSRIEAAGYESDSPSRELARAVAEVSATYAASLPNGAEAHRGGPLHPVLEWRRDRFLRGGDHTSFNQQGFAAVRFTEWREDFHHQHQDVRTENGIEYGDLPKFVDYGYVARVAALNAATLATLADAPPPPVNVGIETRGVDNDTVLTWEPGMGAAPDTQYEIVWRETRAPTWERAELVPPATAGQSPRSLKLAVSKDNVIFGVRALDRAGHRSPAIVPTPQG